MALRLLTSSAGDLISLDDAKLFLRVSGSDQDDVISGLLRAAHEYIVGVTNKSLAVTTWELTLDAFPDDAIRLPVAPLVSVESVTYYDADGVLQTLSTSAYFVDDASDSEPGWIVPGDDPWPATLDAANSLKVRFTAGYEDPADVPERDILTVKVLVAHWYENRQPSVTGTIVADIPLSVQALIGQMRIYL